jgi:hypothetical protein
MKNKNKKLRVEELSALFDDAGTQGLSTALIDEVTSFFEVAA